MKDDALTKKIQTVSIIPARVYARVYLPSFDRQTKRNDDKITFTRLTLKAENWKIKTKAERSMLFVLFFFVNILHHKNSVENAMINLKKMNKNMCAYIFC